MSLVRAVLDGFRYHPYVFMLRQRTSGEPVYPYAHQLELLAYLFPRKPIRVLIGDEIGLGKTVEAILLIRYLRETNPEQKVLILVPRILINQWVSELLRFGFHSTEIYRVERETFRDLIAKGFPQGIYIASIDLAKREDYRERILKESWDTIVVDEAHRVGRVGGRETQRFNLVSSLAKNTDVNLILLSATPHRGKPDDYVERLRLIDPYLSASADELDTEEFYRLVNNSLVFRRTKLDVNNVYEKRSIFTNCKFKARTVKASETEVKFHDKLVGFLRSVLLKYYNKLGERPLALGLLLVLIAKRASSSPKAALITLDRIINRRASVLRSLTTSFEDFSRDLDRRADELVESVLGSGGFEEYDEVLGPKVVDVDEVVNSFAEQCSALLDEHDIKILSEIHKHAQKITSEHDSRLLTLAKIIETHLSKGDKVVVFTEFRDTATYVFEELRKRLPGSWGDGVALISSDVIEPPKTLQSSLRGRKPTIEDVKNWLAAGFVRVLVSTDVASEGLNLQHANVVVHYEPPWSPIKIMQRIGRVWRLGQKKDVVSYTILLPVESDLKALEILYAKLLSWYISGVERRVPIGEELEIDMMEAGARKTGDNIDLLVLAPRTGEKGEKVHFSEYRAWLEFLSKGGRGLEDYVRKILSIIQELKNYIERVKREEGNKEVRVHRLLDDVLGGIYGSSAEKTLLDLLKASARLRGLKVEVKEDRVFLGAGDYALNKGDVSSAYRALEDIVDRTAPRPQSELVLLAAGGSTDADELALYRVELKIGGRPYYSEVIGLERRGDTLDELRGVRLLRALAQVLDKVVGVASSVREDGSGSQEVRRISSRYKDIVIKRILTPFTNYMKGVEDRFSNKHTKWVPRDMTREIQEPEVYHLGRIIFLKTGEAHGAPPPIAVEEVERKAMEIAMEYERRHGREPVDVSKFEHYDIRSFDPVSGEVRFIEVKGRGDSSIQVELTEAEYRHAEELGDRYWLYIVYDIASRPRMLIIRNPAKNVKWAEVGVKRYRLAGVESHGYTESS